MVGLVRFIGIIILLVGIGVIVKPEFLKKMVSFVKVDKRLYWSSGVKTVVGIVFLLAATKCKVPFVIAVMGILFVLSLVICLAMGEKKIKGWIESFDSMPEKVAKIWAIVTVIIGALITFSA